MANKATTRWKVEELPTTAKALEDFLNDASLDGKRIEAFVRLGASTTVVVLQEPVPETN